MPSNTITEFRNKNSKGRDKRKNKKQCVSPVRKSFKKGNRNSIKGFCSHCNPSLANSIHKKINICNTIVEEIKNLL